MARIVKQPLPDPPKEYDQQYMFRLVNALNLFMMQQTAQAEVVTARLILTDVPRVPADMPDTSTLPTGMIYGEKNTTGNKPPYYLSVVTPEDV